VQEHPRLALDSLYTSERATTRSQLVKTSTKISQSSLFVDSLAPEMESRKKETIDEKQVALKAFSPSQTFINKSKQRARDQLPEKEEKEPWLPKMFGGILGTLLALVLLAPIFICVIVVIDFGFGDAPNYRIEEEDSFFVRGFKRSFNAVMSIGLFVFLGILVIGILVLFFALLYSNLGIAGVIFGAVSLVVLFLIWAFFFGTLFEKVFPNL